jgi:hypothetical protein
MAQTVILTTNWGFNWWQTGGHGRFSGTKASERLPNWKELRKKCPLPAIGLYTDKFFESEFAYIVIKDIRVDNDDVPQFEYDFISRGFKESLFLNAKVNRANKKFYFPVDVSLLLESIKSLDIFPPREWIEKFTEIPAVNDVPPTSTDITNWTPYIGQYFLDLRDTSLGSVEFENRTAALLTAIGFKVVQKGHMFPGPVCDGVASHGGDIGLVYDCKNSTNYFPIQEDMRALEQYYQDEKTKHRGREMFPCFIAKKATTQMQGDKLVMTIEPLLYLLFRKITTGADFTVDPIKLFFTNKWAFTIDNIKTHWN